MTGILLNSDETFLVAENDVRNHLMHAYFQAYFYLGISDVFWPLPG